MMGRVTAAAAFILTLLVCSSAQAATFAVNSTTDAASGLTVNCNVPVDMCTLRAAIQAANTASGSNTITLPADTYPLTIAPSGPDDITTGDLNVTSNLTITGAGAATTIIDGGGSVTTATDRVFNVAPAGALTMSGVTVQHGYPADMQSGGGILASGPLTLTGVVVTDNTVTNMAGTTATDQTFGGGIAQGCATNSSCGVVSDPISLTGVTLSDNSVVAPANNYGGGGALFEGDDFPVTIVDSAITGNSAPAGGAIVENGAGPIAVQNTTLFDNHAIGSSTQGPQLGTGGAIEGDGGGSVSLTDDSLTGNTASLGGGAIVDDAGDTYTLTGTTLAGNQAGLSGGAGPGGAIDAAGGGLWTISNSTIAANSAVGAGQAIAESSGSQVTLGFTTIDGTGGGRGAQLSNTGTAPFASSILLSDTIVNGGSGTDCAGTAISSAGHNLVSDSSCGFTASTDIVNPPAGLGLGLLSGNGGPTETEALLSGSPAIEAGGTSCPATDQRGQPRPGQPGMQCDIGAVEVAPPAQMTVHALTVALTGTGTGTVSGTGISCPGTCSQSYPAGTVIALTAKPGTGSTFAGWGGACAGTGVCQVTLSSDAAVTATFSSASVSPTARAPSNVTAPAISGTPLPGDWLSCSEGAWTNSPTRFTYQWNRGGSRLAGATSATYTVQISDEASSLSCTVTAANSTGAGAAKTSAGVLVAMPGTLKCPKPSGRLTATRLGPLALEITRARARHTLVRFAATRDNFDDFCLFAGWGIRVGYPTAKLLASVPAGKRARLAGRIVLALTANPFYALHGVRPGTRLTAAGRKLKLGKPLKIGLNTWYIASGSAAGGVLKVRGAIIQEVGIADRQLTGGRSAERRLLSSFTAASPYSYGGR